MEDLVSAGVRGSARAAARRRALAPFGALGAPAARHVHEKPTPERNKLPPSCCALQAHLHCRRLLPPPPLAPPARAALPACSPACLPPLLPLPACRARCA